MIEGITKYPRTTKDNYPFSVLIPTWNNQAYLQNCIRSIRQNSRYDLQIIVIVNEGKDGTLDWLNQTEEIDFIHAKTNIGICYAVNIARSLAKSDYIIYLNDDMYCLPDWDKALADEIQEIGHKQFMLSGTMIEPEDSGNPCVVIGDYGRDLSDFREDALLRDYGKMYREDWTGSTWPPNVVHRDVWDLVGGLSIEFSPGMYSDPDFSRKLIEAGIRIFKGKGTSLVYHFGRKSTKRVKRNNGRNAFLRKWGMTSNTFTQKILHMGQAYTGPITLKKLSGMDKFVNWVKLVKSKNIQ